jgi:hypothetical protein
MLKAGLI